MNTRVTWLCWKFRRLTLCSFPRLCSQDEKPRVWYPNCDVEGNLICDHCSTFTDNFFVKQINIPFFSFNVFAFVVFCYFCDTSMEAENQRPNLFQTSTLVHGNYCVRRRRTHTNRVVFTEITLAGFVDQCRGYRS